MADKKTSSKTSGTATAAKKAGKSENGATAQTKPAAAAATGNKEKSLAELTASLAETTGLPKNKVKEFLDAHAALLVQELLATRSVQLSGIGKLKLGERAERQGRNPSTGESITIKASKTVKLVSGKAFKEKFN